MEKQKNDIGKKAITAGVWYTISSICVKCASIISTPIFTRLLSTEDYGITSTFTSWYAILSVFCTMCLSYSIGRAKIDFKDDLDTYIGSMQLLSACFTGGIIVCLLAFRSVWSDLMELSPLLIVMLSIYLFFDPAVEFARNGFRYRYRYKENVFISIFITFSTIIFSIIFVLLFPKFRYVGRILGIILPSVILGVLFWIHSIFGKNLQFNFNYWKYGFVISAPLVIHTLALNILAQSDRLMITKFCGSSDTGIYSLVYSYALMVNLVIGAVNEAWLPWFHDTYHQKDFNNIKKNVKPLLLFECFFGIGCIAIAPEAILIFGGKEYLTGIWAVPPIVTGVICQYVYTHYVNVQMTLKRTGYVSLGTGIAALVNIGLNYIFIPQYGFVAAAYTTMAGYLLLVGLHYLINKYIMKSNIYDNRYMLLMIIVMFISSAVFLLLYQFAIYRYILLAILCCVYLFTNRKFLKSFIRQLLERKSQ